MRVSEFHRGQQPIQLHQAGYRAASAWLQDIRKRRPSNVVTVALANKIARTIWAILAHGQPYRSDHVSTKLA
ncbi:hypothetical protein PPGU19_018610 [Paraburkholderia sp. PGU19]|nr:hypothetical protein PPGU19_018610 [Paraburkholderia sp. PGU19]